MKFPLIEFPIRMFSPSKLDRNVLVAEASDLGNRHLQKLYDDAGDVGFAIEGDRSVVSFVMVTVVKDAENEVMYWVYEPTLESKRFVPECRGIKVQIYND